jgi:hypothetical protein
MSEPLYKAHFALDPDALPWRSRVTRWLRDNNRTHHVVNAYANDTQGFIVVLRDRTTAIMLKLALA